MFFLLTIRYYPNSNTGYRTAVKRYGCYFEWFEKQRSLALAARRQFDMFTARQAIADDSPLAAGRFLPNKLPRLALKGGAFLPTKLARPVARTLQLAGGVRALPPARARAPLPQPRHRPATASTHRGDRLEALFVADPRRSSTTQSRRSVRRAGADQCIQGVYVMLTRSPSGPCSRSTV